MPMFKKVLHTLSERYKDWRLKRMPLKSVFEEIYAQNAWGGEKGSFYSGAGSNGSVAEDYAALIKRFIAEREIKSVLDIGCGDFRVGAAFVSPDVQYVGSDIVGLLIERNQREFGCATIAFTCLDAVNDELPDAELCLIRQVLQHLTNAEIERILLKTKKFKYLIVTEHHPAPSLDFEPNRDAIHGGLIRTFSQSGVYPHLPPFAIGEARVLLSVAAPDAPPGEQIVTMLFEAQNCTPPAM
jgi:SAM-dependent methyltransferase